MIRGLLILCVVSWPTSWIPLGQTLKKSHTGWCLEHMDWALELTLFTDEFHSFWPPTWASFHPSLLPAPTDTRMKYFLCFQDSTLQDQPHFFLSLHNSTSWNITFPTQSPFPLDSCSDSPHQEEPYFLSTPEGSWVMGEKFTRLTTGLSLMQLTRVKLTCL